jgi:hypothetical protein
VAANRLAGENAAVLKLPASPSICFNVKLERDRNGSEVRFEPLQVQAARLIGRGILTLTRWLLTRGLGPKPRG